MRIIVTGGAGFIGSALVRHLIGQTGHEVLNIDKLSYAANLDALATVQSNPRYHFARLDICDREALRSVIEGFQPGAILHLAGESHVDRSLEGPDIFVTSNIVGTQSMLEATRRYWAALPAAHRAAFRFLFVSTDEVYGSRVDDEQVDERAPFLPNSPYAGSKAAATHLVRSYQVSYGLPTLTTYCSNNFGPWQYPEKLIPKTINNALNGQAIPVYGQGLQRRDWLYVDDHVQALMRVLDKGTVGSGYNINGGHEISNLELVRSLCARLDRAKPRPDGAAYADQIEFVADRPGHDLRYGIDDSRVRTELGWRPEIEFEQAFDRTIDWHLERNGA